ncbi:Gfo/Idh/MocA family protein [Actinoplanes teichomyceticus]|uniref:Gfo/Idh/MocA family protein n=1 Tax=Actinoplanes teichomyceticus TaxID=1867 RepID=UPI0013DE57F9|nr:Gfo/Idh/MocA family oxidoreductase [Actinoplanes teichomyceticus]
MKFAVVGTGFGAVHLSWLTECRSASVEVLCYNNDDSRARQLAEKHGVGQISSDPVAVIRSGSVDAVAVIAPPGARSEILTAALDAGLLVVCDKPLSVDAGSAETLLRQAEKAGVAGFVTFQWRLNRALRQLRTMLREGRLGRLVALDLEFHHDFLSGPRTAWPWRHDRRVAGAGALADQGVHLFDTILWLTGTPWSVDACRTDTVFASRQTPHGVVDGETEDVASLRLSGGAGASARIFVSRVSAGYRSIRILVQGEKGTAVLSLDPDDGSGNLRVSVLKQPVEVTEFGPDAMNVYRAILGEDADAADVATFADAVAAQKLVDQALSRVTHPERD